LRVREGEVGVVDELELAGALGALWAVRWDAVGVRLERRALVCVSDLLGGCAWGDLEEVI
jgi:hypothetical protein